LTAKPVGFTTKSVDFTTKPISFATDTAVSAFSPFFAQMFQQKQPTLFCPPLFVGEGQKILLKLA
jgi:hypothetical protein